MKKLMLICAFGAFGFTAVNAQQTTQTPQTQHHQTEQEEGDKIQLADIPESIKENIDENIEDRDATVISAERYTEEGETGYKLIFRKDDDSRYMKKYDEQGNVKERKDVDDDDDK